MQAKHFFKLIVPLLLAPFYARLVIQFTGQGGAEFHGEAVMVLRGLSLVVWIVLVAVWGGAGQTAEDKKKKSIFPPLMLGAMVASVLIVLVALI